MKSEIQKQLGFRIQTLRKKFGYSQEKFAEKIGIATNTLSSIETGNAFMTALTLEKIISTLNITPSELFRFDSDINIDNLYSHIINKLNLIKSNKEKMIILTKLVDSLL